MNMRAAGLVLVVASIAVGCGRQAETSNDPMMSDETSRPATGASFAPNLSLPDEFRLAEEKQRYIWDIEARAFVMGQDLQSAFKAIVRDGTLEPLAGFLSDDFRASIYVGRGEPSTVGPVQVERWADGSPTDEIGRDDFLTMLRLLGRSFETLERVDVHAFYLSPEEYGNLDGAWRSRWDVRLAGKFSDGRRAEHRFDIEFRFSRFTMEMKEERGWIDGFRFLRARFTRAPGVLLEEVTESTGILTDRLYDNWNQPKPPWNPVPGTARMFDYDRDGHADLC